MKKIFNSIFKKMGYEVDVKISKSSNADYQCDDLFKIAKEYHTSPIEIGKEFINNINKIENFSNYFKSVEFVEPGFININVSDEYICNSLRDLFSKDILGSTKENKTIVLDYGGPNIAKPLHVGHLRTAIIGQAINNILKYKGNKTISDVHLGDFGLQIGQVIYGILEDKQSVIDIDYLNKTYPRVSALCKEDDNIKEKCALITKELQEGKEEYIKLWKQICEVSINDIKRLYEYLSVSFDYWYGESDAFKEFDEIFKILEEKKVLKKDDGALVIEVKEEDDKITIPPCIVRKSDGAYLYATSDLGTIHQRKREFTPDEMVYITDNRQSLHFTQVFRAALKSDLYDGKLSHYGYGTVNGKDNKPYKTRSGNSIKLEELIEDVKTEFVGLREENKNMDKDDLDKIVNAIIKFADMQNDLEKNYIFDIKKFSEVNGKTGPYILYTYLRINKITGKNNSTLSNNIYNDVDKCLRLKLLEVSNVLDIASLERKPHYIANYLYELSVIANNFYQTNKMSDITGQQKDDFEIILNYTNHVIKTLLNLLGINIPTKM